MWWVKLAAIIAVAYAAVVAVLYFAQTWMLFPTGLAAHGSLPLPETAKRLKITTADGETLAGVHIGPRPGIDAEKMLILGFGGNAWNATNVAAYLHQLYPAHDVVAFHYRGYAPSTGRPAAADLLADGLIIHDQLTREMGPVPIVAVGLSVGAGVAAYLARNRPLRGLVMVTPFDSLEAVAHAHFPWAPVRWLLRHRMPILDLLRGQQLPTALIAAERDTIIPPARTAPLRTVIANLVLDRIIAGAGHNDLYATPAFAEAMGEALKRIEGQGVPPAPPSSGRSAPSN